ncbi:MAG: endolytic transglycosylase MltG [Bacteroidetes bacterium]|nr:endolytic transglycosylase MltG [Bacteroidota bacterium]
MRTRNFILIAFVLTVLLSIAVMTIYHASHTHEQTTPVDIPSGTSLRGIAEILADHDIISSRSVFIVAAKLTSRSARLKSGLYLFPPSLSIHDALTILVAGSHQAYRDITIREGLTLRRIAGHLEHVAGFPADTILYLAHDADFIRSLGKRLPSLEGYLFPDTYRMRYDESPRVFLARMARAMDAVFTDEIVERMRSMRRDRHEILTMASLVEGETRVPGERKRVAGVYYNRLRIGMLLQADPTVQYIIPDSPRRLLYRDLSIDNPYNTYMYPGLPPGPVNNPGKAAILASLYPETHDFLYFVADGRGGHVFTRTLEEHNRAVAEYRRSRRNR